MQIMTCLVEHDDGSSLPYACLQHEGKLWLVTAWLIDHATRVALPERMVRLDRLDPKPQKGAPGSKIDYVNIRLPKAVIEGHSDATPGFEVRDCPSSPVVDSRDLKPLPLFR